MNLTVELKKTSLDFVWCPAGQFLMGSPEDDPYGHMLDKRSFSMTLTEGFWIASTPMTYHHWFDIFGHQSQYEDGRNFDGPVAQVSWYESRTFCRNLTQFADDQLPKNAAYKFELPTEAQWEYACRAGTATTWHFGRDVTLLPEYACFRANPIGRLEGFISLDHLAKQLPPVGTKKPNPWGLYDCYGLVREWCLGGFFGYPQEYNALAPDPRVQRYLAPSEAEMFPPEQKLRRRIVRGGALDEPYTLCRSASRSLEDADGGEGELTGLRPVLTKII